MVEGGLGVPAAAVERDDVEGAVELSVAAAVEPMTLSLAARCLHGAGAGQCGERRFAFHSLGVAAGDDELGGADGADAAFGEQVRHEFADDRFELPVELVDLAAQLLCSQGDPTQHRDRDGRLVGSRTESRGAFGGLFAVEAEPARFSVYRGVLGVVGDAVSEVDA